MNLENLKLVESPYCSSDKKYIYIKQISLYEQLRGSTGNWFQHGMYGLIYMFDICYVENENGVYNETSIPYNELPQSVLDYLKEHDYFYRPQKQIKK